jgi:hypothetical protein
MRRPQVRIPCDLAALACGDFSTSP